MRLQRVFETKLKAVFIWGPVGWLCRRPEHALPGGAVRPLPDALLPDVVTSDPGRHKAGAKVFACQAFQDELLGVIGVDRGQMATFLTAKVLSCGPVHLLLTPEVAMGSVLLPTFRAGLDAFVLAAG